MPEIKVTLSPDENNALGYLAAMNEKTIQQYAKELLVETLPEVRKCTAPKKPFKSNQICGRLFIHGRSDKKYCCHNCRIRASEFNLRKLREKQKANK